MGMNNLARLAKKFGVAATKVTEAIQSCVRPSPGRRRRGRSAPAPAPSRGRHATGRWGRTPAPSVRARPGHETPDGGESAGHSAPVQLNPPGSRSQRVENRSPGGRGCGVRIRCPAPCAGEAVTDAGQHQQFVLNAGGAEQRVDVVEIGAYEASSEPTSTSTRVAPRSAARCNGAGVAIGPPPCTVHPG